MLGWSRNGPDNAPQPVNETATPTPAEPVVTKDTRAEALDLVPVPEEPCALRYFFDDMVMCYTPALQARYYYRYGKMKPCGEALQNWMWCLSTKSQSSEDAQVSLRQRRLEKWDELLQGPNSEDVWTIRQAPIEPGWRQSS